jgi:hypothetical protein
MQDWEQGEWKDLDPVADQYVKEEGHSQRDDEQRVVRDVGLDQAAQLVVAPFEYRLDLAGSSLLEL